MTATGGYTSNSYGIQVDGGNITIDGGTVTAMGGTAAMGSVPALGGYTDPHHVTASTNPNGVPATTYSAGSISTYKYLRIAPPPTDEELVFAAKAEAEGADYPTSVTQASAPTAEALNSTLHAIAEEAVNNSAVEVEIMQDSYLAPIAGTSANVSGSNGRYTFKVTVSKGGTSGTTAPITVDITATAYTGISDTDAVAAAKAALLGGSVNVPFGASQTVITAAIQAYVDGFLTGDALGVTAGVTYIPISGGYMLTLRKGDAVDTNPPCPSPSILVRTRILR